MIKYGESYITASSTATATAKRSTVKPLGFDIVSVSKLRALGYVNYSPILLDALNLNAIVTISPDVGKFRAVRQAEANLNGYTNLVLDTRNYVRTTSALTTTAQKELKEAFAQIWNFQKMNTTFIEGHTIQYEITDGYVYNSSIECYSTPKVLYTFKIPYQGQSNNSSQFNVAFTQDPSRIRFASSTLPTTYTMTALPFDFTKAQSFLLGPFSINGINIRNRFISATQNFAFTQSSANSRVRLGSKTLPTISTINSGTPIRRRTSTGPLTSSNSIFAGSRATFQGRSYRSLTMTISGTLTKFLPVPVYLTTSFTASYNNQRIRTATGPLNSSTTITANRTLGTWQPISNYSPGSGFSVYSVRLANDYSAVLSTGTTPKLDLIDTTTRTLVRNFTMPSGHVLQTPSITSYTGNYQRRTMIAMSTNYVAAITLNGATYSVVVFNKNTGTHLYTITTDVNSTSRIDLTDNILAILTYQTGSEIIKFYQANDGTFIQTDTLSTAVEGFVCSGTGKFAVWFNWVNRQLRIYDITGTAPSYISRNTRDDETVFMISPTYYAVYSNANAIALTDGTRPLSYDINNNSTVTASVQPDIANYPLTSINSNISAAGDFNDVYMTDQFIFTTLTSTAKRLGTYVTNFSTLTKNDVLESTNGAVLGATDEYLVINGNWYQNTAN